MSIPFIDLKAQFRHLECEIREGIDRVLEHGQFIMGPEIAELESELARFAGVEHAITCSSGTDALLMPLMAYGVGPGDAVLTTPFTFIATAEVISLLGATPVFVDIDPRTFNIDPDRLEKVVREHRQRGKLRLRGIIAVDLFGLPADYDAIDAIANANELFVIQDAAQSFGSEYKGRRAGSLGDVAATSFFPAKPLGCYGDGGAVLTDDQALAEVIRSIRVHGKGANKYDNVRIGINGRLDTLQAAILLPKLRAFPEELAARQRVAARYTDSLHNVITTPTVPENCTSAWAQYSVLSDRRDELRSGLTAAGVPSVVYYPKPLHAQAAYAGSAAEDECPVSDRTAEQILSVPMHPYMDTSTQDRVIEAIARTARSVA